MIKEIEISTLQVSSEHAGCKLRHTFKQFQHTTK
jgi:hypothetical protein